MTHEELVELEAIAEAAREEICAEVKAAIDRSIHYDEIVHIHGIDEDDVMDVASDLGYSTDYVRVTYDGYTDIWGYEKYTPDNEQVWRIYAFDK